MNGKDIINLGYQQGPAVGLALSVSEKAISHGTREKDVSLILSAILDKPKDFLSHDIFGELAKYLVDQLESDIIEVPTEPKPYHVWGKDMIEKSAIDQMNVAMSLPVSVFGSVMADAHQGYGLPVGGVLATENSVVPNAVGLDIACRMKLSLLDISTKHISTNREILKDAIVKHTAFGVGAKFTGRNRREHEVMDDPMWNSIPHMKHLKDLAHEQLGTSGSGNHFLNFGVLTVNKRFGHADIGEYLAVLTHSGSRGPGAQTASHYKNIAIRKLHKKLEIFKNLAWLKMDSEEGQEYWEAMNLMGRFASANHELIHYHVSKHIGARIVDTVENHHNFAWKENHHGREVYVHRKGATPAGSGVLGVIPGSMADSCFVVKGKGNADSLNSSSHGAGRLMSRKAAKEKFSWNIWKKKLENAGVELISAGIDEVPGCYKNIHDIMKAQEDLVEIVAEFKPKIVMMSDGGRAED